MDKTDVEVSDFFRVAVSGKTADGRTIEESWLEEAAQHFDSTYFPVRIWPEHIRGVEPGGTFKPLGDVVALKTQVDTIKGKDKLCLYAQINPLPGYVELVKSGEKIHTSIEIEPEFADLGAAYMVGMAATDSPASLGTQVIKFSKEAPNKFYSDALETSITFTQQAASGTKAESMPPLVKELFNYLRGFFSANNDPHDTPNTPKGADMDEQTLETINKRLDDMESRLTALEGVKEEVVKEATEEVKQELEQVVEEAKTEVETAADAAKEAADEAKTAADEVKEEIKEAKEEFKRFSKKDAGQSKRSAATGKQTYSMPNY